MVKTTRKSNVPARGIEDEQLADPVETRVHGFKRKQKLNSALISMSHTSYLVCRVLSKVYDAPMPTIARNEDGTIPCCRICNLEDGEIATLIVPAVFKSILQGYDDPVGMCFEIVRGEVVAGKNYRALEVYEIDDPSPEDAPKREIVREHDDYQTGN